MMDAEEDTYVSCPYDKHHRVLRSHFHRHIMKCEKHYPKLAICPFNASHRIPFEMKTAHCLSCPNRPDDEPSPKAKAAQVWKGGAVSAPAPMLQKEFISKDDPDYECWD